AALHRGGLSFGNHGGDALADEPRDAVEHVGVVGIDAEVVVTGRGERPPRNVLPDENGVDSGNGERLILADGRDACVRVGGADDFEVKHPLHRDVHGVTGTAGDDPLGQGVGETGPAYVAGTVRFDGRDAADRILDRVIAGAAAEVPLQM